MHVSSLCCHVWSNPKPLHAALFTCLLQHVLFLVATVIMHGTISIPAAYMLSPQSFASSAGICLASSIALDSSMLLSCAITRCYWTALHVDYILHASAHPSTDAM